MYSPAVTSVAPPMKCDFKSPISLPSVFLTPGDTQGDSSLCSQGWGRILSRLPPGLLVWDPVGVSAASTYLDTSGLVCNCLIQELDLTAMQECPPGEWKCSRNAWSWAVCPPASKPKLKLNCFSTSDSSLAGAEHPWLHGLGNTVGHTT